VSDIEQGLHNMSFVEKPEVSVQDEDVRMFCDIDNLVSHLVLRAI